MRGHLALARYLVKQGADVNAQAGPASSGPLELLLARRPNMPSLAELALLLIAAGARVDGVTDSGPALDCAVSIGVSEIVEAMIARGADVNVRSRRGYTPLHSAALVGDWEIVKLLVAHGANPQAKNRNGFTPLDYVRRHDGMERFIEELLVSAREAGERRRSEPGPAGEGDWTRP